MTTTPRRSRPLVVVSADSHVGPRLDDLRDYCPAAARPAFDEFVTGFRATAGRAGFFGDDFEGPDRDAFMVKFVRNLATDGHHEMHARLRDMDHDGVAAEVIFHNSLNGEPIPFVGVDFFFDPTPERATSAALGYHLYNQWLADVCTIEAERHVGIAYLPLWDVEAAIRELEWARSVGLRGVNLPAPRPGIRPLDDPEWEPFWAACEAHGMVLATHAGAGNMAEYQGPHAFSVLEIEAGGWPARRGLHRMIFSGVFARHPGLVFVVTEQNGEWWSATVREYDSSYHTHRWQIADRVPELPSTYLHRNVFIGASFMAPFEAQAAVREGYADNVIWGRDYPHPEGTFVSTDDPEAPSRSVLSMRYCFAGLPDDAVTAMAGANGVRAYGLDAEALQRVADRIGAPTLTELTTPLDEIPPDGGVLAFRTIGPWG